jgi:transcriptional regulator with XRE-family HTH domain
MEKLSEEEFYWWIAQEVRHKRALARLKTKELAKKVDVDPTFISKIEGGVKLSAYRFYEILYELGYTLEVVERKKMYQLDIPEEDRAEMIHITDAVDKKLKQLPELTQEPLFEDWSRFKAKLKLLLDVDLETVIQDIRQDMTVQNPPLSPDQVEPAEEEEL